LPGRLPHQPKRESIGARACLPSVEALPEGVDVAVLAIPRAFVLDTVRGLAARKVGSAIIFAAGFAEEGEEALPSRPRSPPSPPGGHGDRGPNCLGLVNHVDGVPLTFVETPFASRWAVRCRWCRNRARWRRCWAPR
jgi:acyl-CoA synthetase (NDP forming)